MCVEGGRGGGGGSVLVCGSREEREGEREALSR